MSIPDGVPRIPVRINEAEGVEFHGYGEEHGIRYMEFSVTEKGAKGLEMLLCQAKILVVKDIAA